MEADPQDLQRGSAAKGSVYTYHLAPSGRLKYAHEDPTDTTSEAYTNTKTRSVTGVTGFEKAGYQFLKGVYGSLSAENQKKIRAMWWKKTHYTKNIAGRWKNGVYIKTKKHVLKDSPKTLSFKNLSTVALRAEELLHKQLRKDEGAMVKNARFGWHSMVSHGKNAAGRSVRRAWRQREDGRALKAAATIAKSGVRAARGLTPYGHHRSHQWTRSQIHMGEADTGPYAGMYAAANAVEEG
jgi:hypothetical protein